MHVYMLSNLASCLEVFELISFTELQEEIIPMETPEKENIPKEGQKNNKLNLATHLIHVYNHTKEACKKWFDIGLQLGLEHHHLKLIERKKDLHDDSAYYRQMLVDWMNKGEATMEKLLEVFDMVSMGDVVQKIRDLGDKEKALLGL